MVSMISIMTLTNSVYPNLNLEKSSMGKGSKNEINKQIDLQYSVVWRLADEQRWVERARGRTSCRKRTFPINGSSPTTLKSQLKTPINIGKLFFCFKTKWSCLLTLRRGTKRRENCRSGPNRPSALSAMDWTCCVYCLF